MISRVVVVPHPPLLVPELPVSLGAGVADAPSGPDLPLPALIAGWLRAKAGADTVGWGGPWRSRVDYSAAPYGVGYHVAVWDPVR